MKILAGGLGALLLVVLMNGQTLNATTSCESLASLALPNTKITLAQTVSAGAFTPPAAAGAATPTPAAGQPFKALSAFCRVAATLKLPMRNRHPLALVVGTYSFTYQKVVSSVGSTESAV